MIELLFENLRASSHCSLVVPDEVVLCHQISALKVSLRSFISGVPLYVNGIDPTRSTSGRTRPLKISDLRQRSSKFSDMSFESSSTSKFVGSGSLSVPV